MSRNKGEQVKSWREESKGWNVVHTAFLYESITGNKTKTDSLEKLGAARMKIVYCEYCRIVFIEI